MKYQDYLKTETWMTIRAQRLAIDNGECVLCGEKAENVHHRRYPKKLGTETVKDLVSLCSDCHRIHHDKPNRIDPVLSLSEHIDTSSIIELACNVQSNCGSLRPLFELLAHTIQAAVDLAVEKEIVHHYMHLHKNEDGDEK